MSKVAQDNQVYFEFHHFHYCVKYSVTQVFLLKGKLIYGLYEFDLDLKGMKSYSSSALTNFSHLL